MIVCKRIETGSIYYQAERELRNTVLLRPIGIPDYGWEMNDDNSFHFVALNGKDVVGCVVLFPVPSYPGDIQLMQMAVLDSFRGKNIGRKLVHECIKFARSEGFTRIVCHSRIDAVGFYEKLGFVCFGEPFEEVGVVHRNMEYIISE